MIKTAERWSLFLNYSRMLSQSLDEIQDSAGELDPQKRVDFLLERARHCMLFKAYNHAAVLAWFVLSEIDHESSEAKRILKQTYRLIFLSQP